MMDGDSFEPIHWHQSDVKRTSFPRKRMAKTTKHISRAHTVSQIIQLCFEEVPSDFFLKFWSALLNKSRGRMLAAQEV